MMISRHIHADKQISVKLWLNLTLLILFSATVISAFVDIQGHKWLGGSMSVAVALHLAEHWSWVRAVGSRFLGRISLRLRVKAIVDILMLIMFLLLALSGIIVGTIYAPNIIHFHKLCFYMLLGLVFLHLVLNWQWLVANVKRRSKFKLKHK